MEIIIIHSKNKEQLLLFEQLANGLKKHPRYYNPEFATKTF
jgi:hypothetical protein